MDGVAALSMTLGRGYVGGGEGALFNYAGRSKQIDQEREGTAPHPVPLVHETGWLAAGICIAIRAGIRPRVQVEFLVLQLNLIQYVRA